MKIIAFCNIQFICHLLHEKSLTLPNWFCPSFFPPRGPQILCKIWPAISAYLHFTPVEEKNCVESNSGISQAGIIIAASIVNISRRSFTCSNIALQAENLSCHFTFKTRPSPGLVQPMHQMSLLCLLTTTRLTHSQLMTGETLSWAGLGSETQTPPLLLSRSFSYYFLISRIQLSDPRGEGRGRRRRRGAGVSVLSVTLRDWRDSLLDQELCKPTWQRGHRRHSLLHWIHVSIALSLLLEIRNGGSSPFVETLT